MYLVDLSGRHSQFVVAIAAAAFFLCFFFTTDATAQSAVNSMGNGGRHSIHGRIYASNGRRGDIVGLRIRLINFSSGELSVITDGTGAFGFKNLNAGSYSVVIEGGDEFENAQEGVYIDDPGSSSIRGARVQMRSEPKIVNVQLYLNPKAKTPADAPPSVLSAKWATVPKAALQHYENGREFLAQGKTAEAEMQFRKSLEASPSFAPALAEIGKLELKAGKLDAAVESFRRAIRYDASDFEAHLNLGIALLNQKKYDQAEPELVTSAFINRTAVTPHYYLGIIFVIRNELDIARKAFETARDLKGSKSLPAIHKYLGRVYMAKRLDKEAILELEKYLNLAPAAQDAERVRKDISDIRARKN